MPPHSRAHTRWGGGGATVPGQLGRDRSGQIRQRQGVHGGRQGARGAASVDNAPKNPTVRSKRDPGQRW